MRRVLIVAGLLVGLARSETIHVISNFTATIGEEGVPSAAENWAYPLDQCVATGAYGTGEPDAWFTCSGSMITVKYFEQDMDCDASAAEGNYTWDSTGIASGEFGYANCAGETSYMRLNYAIGEDCEEPDFSYTATMATDVCVKNRGNQNVDLPNAYTTNMCDEDSAAVSAHNESTCSGPPEGEQDRYYNNCTEIEDTLTVDLDLITVTLPIYVRMELCVTNDVQLFSTNVPEGDNDVDVPSGESADIGEGTGTTESATRHFIGSYSIGGGRTTLFAYPLDTCVRRGTSLSTKTDAVYSCSDSDTLVRSVYDSRTGECEGSVSGTKTYELGDLTAGKKGYFKCDGEENTITLRQTYTGGCDGDDYFDQIQASEVCIQPDVATESYTYAVCNSDESGSVTTYSSSTCTGTGSVNEIADECGAFEETTILGTTYQVTAEIRNCVIDGSSTDSANFIGVNPIVLVLSAVFAYFAF